MTTPLRSDDDVVIASAEPPYYGSQASGLAQPTDTVGDIIFRTAGVERARIKADGTGTGWPSVLGGSLSAVGGLTVADDLVEPFYIAHRGGSCVYPENTIEGYRAILATGHKVLEAADVHRLRDGSLAVMHDDTLTRQTTSTGNVADQLSSNWAKLVLDCSSWFPTFADTRPPFYHEILSMVAGKAVIFPEAKNAASGQLLYNALETAGMLKSAIVNSFLPNELTPFVNAGLPVMYNPTATTETPASIIAKGALYVGLIHGGTATSAYITSLVAAGLKPVVSVGSGNGYGRRILRDAYLAIGVVGFFCDDPLWTSGEAPVLLSDPFATLTWYPGMIPGFAPRNITDVDTSPAPGAAARGSFLGTGRFGFTTSGPLWTLLGPISPIANKAGTYRITFTFTYDQLSTSDTTRWPAFVFGCDDDRDFRGNVKGNGYLVFLRENGQLELFKYTGDNGTPTQLGSTVTTAALSAGNSATIQIDVTPTQITVTRTTGAAAPYVLGPVSDTTYRGGYCHFGKEDLSKDGHYSISAITVS